MRLSLAHGVRVEGLAGESIGLVLFVLARREGAVNIFKEKDTVRRRCSNEALETGIVDAEEEISDGGRFKRTTGAYLLLESGTQ